jgi:hypothetical protein
MEVRRVKKIVAVIVGWWVRAITREWALRRGFEHGVATLMAWAAGVTASAVVLSI